MSKLHISASASLDLLRLIDSRLLIQANSGGGKSWLMRLIAEQAAGHVQVIILDPEGEFASLREHYDFLLVGRGGEIPAELRAAGLLARRLLELQASAVIDLYDLRLPDRRRFVRLFLESLMHLPKECWRPLLVMLDEAHHYCPERSAGEAESTAAVIDLMSQGRKRSYCGVLATQRLSKLHKDAEAETNNIFIGRTWLDIDQKRAGDLLGFGKEDRQALRDLAAGEFFAFGPALSSPGVSRLTVGAVRTTHPKAGQRHKLTPPEPSEAVRRIVADLADLPQQAEAEIRDMAGAKKKIADLERQLRQRPAAEPRIERVEIPVITDAQIAEMKPVVEAIRKAVVEADQTWRAFGGIGEAWQKAIDHMQGRRAANETPKILRPPAPRPSVNQPPPVPRPPRPTGGEGSTLPEGERKILTAVAQHPDGCARNQLSVLTGYKRSSRDAYIQRLRNRGYVSQQGEQITATPDGIAALGSEYTPLPTGDALRSYWLTRLPEGERKILEVLIERHPAPVPREHLDEETGYRRSSRDAYIQRLCSRRLAVAVGRGAVRASDDLFD